MENPFRRSPDKQLAKEKAGKLKVIANEANTLSAKVPALGSKDYFRVPMPETMQNAFGVQASNVRVFHGTDASLEDHGTYLRVDVYGSSEESPIDGDQFYIGFLVSITKNAKPYLGIYELEDDKMTSTANLEHYSDAAEILKSINSLDSQVQIGNLSVKNS